MQLGKLPGMKYAIYIINHLIPLLVFIAGILFERWSNRNKS